MQPAAQLKLIRWTGTVVLSAGSLLMLAGLVAAFLGYPDWAAPGLLAFFLSLALALVAGAILRIAIARSLPKLSPYTVVSLSAVCAILCVIGLLLNPSLWSDRVPAWFGHHAGYILMALSATGYVLVRLAHRRGKSRQPR